MFKRIDHVALHVSALALVLLVGCADQARLTARESGRDQGQAESQKLNQLFHDYFEESLRLFPLFATSLGDHRYDDQLPNTISEDHRRQQRILYTRYLDTLSHLDDGSFEGEDRLNYDLFKRQLTMNVEGLQFPSHLIPVRQFFSLPVEFPLLGSGRGGHPFKTVQDYDNFLKRAEGFQAWMETAIANMRKGVELGIVPPKVVMEKTLPQLEAMLVVNVRRSQFYRTIVRMPETFDEAERARLTQAFTHAIEEKIIPAYRKLHTFIVNEYLPRCRTTVGLSDLPGGSAWYVYLVRVHTTTDLTPDEIFQIGVNEVERIRREMERMKEETGVTGSLADFARYLAQRSGPGYTTREGVINGYKEMGEKIGPELPKLFGHIPQARYEIRAVEVYRERSAPSQYRAAPPDGSRPGIFYANLAGIKDGPVRALEWLFLHEALPGHHLQISLQRERSDLPKFRRFGGYTAYAEGWGLYAEGLGRELGLYNDPHQYFLRLNSELFRAVRLIVDVGLHHKGWTRAQALEFMREKMLISESGATLEVDRYIAQPGQALAYKIGQLRISTLRAKAEKALGSRFDIRVFHDELLAGGSLPLDLLDATMDAWIKRQLR